MRLAVSIMITEPGPKSNADLNPLRRRHDHRCCNAGSGQQASRVRQWRALSTGMWRVEASSSGIRGYPVDLQAGTHAKPAEAAHPTLFQHVRSALVIGDRHWRNCMSSSYGICQNTVSNSK